MRKLLAIILTIIFVLSSSVVFAEGVDFSAMTDDELRNLKEAIDVELATRQAAAALANGIIAEGDLGDYHVAIMSANRATDYTGSPAVKVTYMFTNNGTATEMFMSVISDMVFQNGVQCEVGIVMDGTDSMASMTNVKPGASIEVTQAYVLRDTSSPIEIEVGKLFDFSDKPEKIVATVALPE